MIEQQERRRDRLATVDEELLGHKENKKLFRAAAYSMGLGIGFLFLIPLLPDIGDEAKAEAMAHVFNVISYLMIGYSLAVTFSFFFLRANIKLVMFMLNWILVPMVGLWCLTTGYKIITG